jgi:hypothetical protein
MPPAKEERSPTVQEKKRKDNETDKISLFTRGNTLKYPEAQEEKK